MANHYEATAALSPGRSAFDLSNTHIFDADPGRLIPVCYEDVLPGDVFDIGMMNVIRAQPMVTPIYHKLTMYVHYFFVPYRILDNQWQKFITGGASGDENVPLMTVGANAIDDVGIGQAQISRYGLWDYLGWPIFDGPDAEDTMFLTDKPIMPDLPWRAFWSIWRDYYRDSNHQTYYPIDSTLQGTPTPCQIYEDPDDMLNGLEVWCQSYTDQGELQADRLPFRCWAKDYFTSALPWQQRGTAPVIPIAGTAAALWDTITPDTVEQSSVLQALSVHPTNVDPRLYLNSSGAIPGIPSSNILGFLNSNVVNFTAAGVDVAELRLAVQTQKWMERNARCGYRYNEFIRARFGVSPNDERLQRPEYIGGSKQPIIISESLQASETTATSPQGNMAGHGMSVDSSHVARYRAQEHGCIIGIMSIMPEALYQQGVPRMFNRTTRFDYYFPEFAHISEQEIRRGELYYQNSSADDNRFGFQAAWDEYRTRNSIVCGKMANDLDVWHLSRQFASSPSLNADFLTTEQWCLNRRSAWAVPGVQTALQGEFLVQWRNLIKAVRPLPYISDPGMIDHF